MPADVSDLLTWAWLRRKQFEARIQAVEIVNVLGQAMSRDGDTPRATERTTADGLLAQMGITLE